MPYAIYDIAIPPMIRGLSNLSKIIDKAVAQAKNDNIPLSDLLEARLAPDMHTFTRQIQMLSDIVKAAGARLAGVDRPSMPDTESTFPELQQRIAKTIDFIKSIDPAKVAGAEDRIFTVKFQHGERNLSGHDFLTTVALPNFYFHMTTAYALLRHKGINIGKVDFLGRE